MENVEEDKKGAGQTSMLKSSLRLITR